VPVDVIMPALGMAQETGKVVRWLKADGDAVSKGEPLVEVETDKVTVEIEAPGDGTLAAVSAVAGSEVPVGTVIALVLADGDEPVPSVVAPEGKPARLASPKARRLAQARGVTLESLAGSGPGGAVVAADVEALSTAAGVGFEPGTVWRVMAERTQRAWQDVPQFSLSRDVDASRLASWRDAARQLPGCDRIGVTDLLLHVSAEALRRHPRVNASWRDGTIVAGSGINIGVAVATEDGLVVPVVHDADTLPLASLVARRRELTDAARARRLTPGDVQNGTFTISNLGMYGVDAFEAIVNAPEAAILAVGRIVERPVALNGEIVVRPVLTMTVSFDHRVADGARGAEFLDTLASLVEEPAELDD
jgi:pyruvate dehydrogenase E2 component (dihydrolipoamide acetyltransferase)